MDQDRARSLLIAERDEVRNLLKETEAAGQADRVAEVESEAEDNADAALALTEETAQEIGALRERLVAAGARVMEPLRASANQRFFFREPVNGYVFEVIAQA